MGGMFGMSTNSTHNEKVAKFGFHRRTNSISKTGQNGMNPAPVNLCQLSHLNELDLAPKLLGF